MINVVVSLVTVSPGVTSNLNDEEKLTFDKELEALCTEYDLSKDRLTDGNGPFQADLMALLKSYGFKAEETAPDLFDELKSIG